MTPISNQSESRNFRFEITATSGRARAGLLTTGNGQVQTPAFMPVGTAGTVKAMTPDSLLQSGTQILLANTYHLMLRPGAEVIYELGGLHGFMNWQRPILTDSGGFQILSLASLREISKQGVTFRSHLDGTKRKLTPEMCIETQALFGVDIAMVLDECTPYPASHEVAESSMHLSLNWAERSKEVYVPTLGCGVFGIIQGGIYPDLRAECVRELLDLEFDGYAIGGLAVGEGQKTMFEVIDYTEPLLPESSPRYLMGVGKPADIIGAVSRGIDMFDCVLPTRSARTGQAFTSRGTVNIKNTRHSRDSRPLDNLCTCGTCLHYSRSYLHHLVRSKEILAAILLTTHNLTFYHNLVKDLRIAIMSGHYEEMIKMRSDMEAKGDICAL